MLREEDQKFYKEALGEAKKSLNAGGIPIGAVLVAEGKILGRGHNQRVQKSSAILHGEMDALERAGRLSPAIYQQCTLYTTLSPCMMCTGTALLYKIPRVVIGENMNFLGGETLLQSQGVEIVVLQDAETIQLMGSFIQANPHLWFEDIGALWENAR